MSRKSPFLLMILALLCASARGAEPLTPAESLSYERCDTGIRITGLLDETLTQLNLPPEIDGLPVTEIGPFAFSGCSSLTSVTIPESVAVIADLAFFACTGLTSVTIPRSVQVLVCNTFDDCTALAWIQCDPENPNFKSVDGVLFSKDGKTLDTFPAGFSGAYTIPEGVAEVENWAFATCSGLTRVTIPDSVTKIGTGAFFACTGLTRVDIPEGVTVMERAFEGCTALTIHAPAGSAAERFAKENGIPFAAE